MSVYILNARQFAEYIELPLPPSSSYMARAKVMPGHEATIAYEAPMPLHEHATEARTPLPAATMNTVQNHDHAR